MTQLCENLAVRSNDLALIHAFNENAVRYLVVGGVAVQFHGCRRWNEVDDLDLLVEANAENGARVRQSLRTMSDLFNITEEQLQKPGLQLKLRAPYHAEILTAGADVHFNELLSRAISVEYRGTVLPIASLDDVVELKEKVVDTLKKHQRDLDCLREKLNDGS